MFLYLYGRILARIGDGCCSEEEVIISARDLLKTGNYKFQPVSTGVKA